jgi:cytochrome c oxidase assembly protein subunit 15
VGGPLVRRPLALLVSGIAAVTAVVLVLGTVVTGSGPHSGDVDADDVPTGDRMGFDVELVSQLHADAVFLLVGLTVALLLALHATDAPDRVRRAARDLLVVQLAQGVVGYVQYFTDLPIALVLVHMLGAVLVTAFTARLVWSVRGPSTDAPVAVPDRQAAATG